MSVYLDTSFLVALFTDDLFSARAEEFFRNTTDISIVSDFAATELASVISRHVRMNELTMSRAREILTDFDAWVMGRESTETVADDIRQAATILRRLDLPLRAPDTIHIAISRRVGARLATFDERMAASAAALGVAVVQA